MAPAISDDNRKLFEGVSAVEAAGGLKPFACEVLAETKRLGLERVKRCGAGDEASAHQVLTDTLCEVVKRRLDGDMRREMERAAQDAVNGHTFASKDQAMAAADAATRRVCELQERRIHALMKAMH